MKGMKKEQINGAWYWVSDSYPTKPYNKILIGSTPDPPPNTGIPPERLWNRITEVEQANLSDRDDKKEYKWFFKEMGIKKGAGMIDVTSSAIIKVFDDAENNGDIAAGRAAEILAI